jgi:hypothetical protein
VGTGARQHKRKGRKGGIGGRMSVKHNKGNNRMSDIGNNIVLPTTVTRASGLTASGLVASGLAASGLTASGLAASGLAAFGLTASGLAASGLTASGRAASGLTASGLADSGPEASGLGALGERESEDYQEKRLKNNQGQSVQQDRRIAKSYRGSGEDCTGAVGEVRKGVG